MQREMKIKMPLTEAEIRNALKDVYDPEVPVNIVDLGLVYRVQVEPDSEAPGMVPKQKVSIDLTLTSPGCPSHKQITEQIHNRLAGFQELSESQVNLVWEPKWSPARISPEAKKNLGIA
jgi:metal-sulfur cluster biosynthetic enzyme